MPICGLSPAFQWLLLLLLASGPFCHAERLVDSDRNTSGITDTPSATKLESPPPKQPLFKTLAEMGINSNGASLAEELVIEGSCSNRHVWARTPKAMLGEGAYAEIFEVAQFDPVREQWKTGPDYALKVAKTVKDGKQMTAEKIEQEKKNVNAEADLLSTIHNNYKLAGKGDLCPNVVPMLARKPCVYNQQTKRVESLSGAYVTIKMTGDLLSWKRKRLDPARCRGRGGKDVYREQLLNGLNCVHEYGKMAHHDLKEDNVLYDTVNADKCPENLYIADFGLSEPLGRETGSFDHKWLTKSGHLVEDVIAGASSNLDIKLFKQKYVYTVFQDVEYKRGTKQVVQNPHRAVMGTRESGAYKTYDEFQACCTTRLVDRTKPIIVETVEDGYTVDRRIDYCSLLYMVDSVFNWGVLIPNYDSEETMNCGKMGNDRVETYTGKNR